MSVFEIADPAERSRTCDRILRSLPEWFGIAAAEDRLRGEGVEYLQVKTLGPSRPSANYELTRRFYEKVGFRPLDEIHGLWSEGNPCLVMVKRLPG